MRRFIFRKFWRRARSGVLRVTPIGYFSADLTGAFDGPPARLGGPQRRAEPAARVPAPLDRAERRTDARAVGDRDVALDAFLALP